jgi:hypothetical protein
MSRFHPAFLLACIALLHPSLSHSGPKMDIKGFTAGMPYADVVKHLDALGACDSSNNPIIQRCSGDLDLSHVVRCYRSKPWSSAVDSMRDILCNTNGQLPGIDFKFGLLDQLISVKYSFKYLVDNKACLFTAEDALKCQLLKQLVDSISQQYGNEDVIVQPYTGDAHGKDIYGKDAKPGAISYIEWRLSDRIGLVLQNGLSGFATPGDYQLSLVDYELQKLNDQTIKDQAAVRATQPPKF